MRERPAIIADLSGEAPSPVAAPTVPAADPRIRARAILAGLAAQAVSFLWVADSEIRQSVYLVCYSLLMPAVVALLSMMVWNASARRLRPRACLSRQDMAIVYLMLTCSLPIAGFGGLRFLLPALGLPFYRTTADNWTRFGASLPSWLAPRGPAVWPAFFRGGDVPWAAWFWPILFWSGFLLMLAGAWLCLGLLLRRRWADEERLTFPIVYLPMQMVAEPRTFFGCPLMWVGFAIPAILQSALALNHLYPSVPAVQLKAWDAGVYLSARPWSAIGYLPVGLYPSAVGLAYFVPTDVSFSCWFFYLLTRMLNVAGAVAGMDMSGQSQAATRFPYPQEQAAGAWVAFGAMALLGLRGRSGARPSASLERNARAGLGVCCGAALALAMAAGVPPIAAALMLGVYGLYVVCGARVRAEVGAQWTFAPLIWTPTQVAFRSLGTLGLGDRGVVMTSLFESVNVDVRGQAMPNQMEGFRLGSAHGITPGRVARVFVLATLTGLVLAWVTSLWAWHDVGAGTAKANSYALTKSQIVWRGLARTFDNRQGPDGEGLAAAGLGAGLTVWLARMRYASVAWPFHPIGYVLANTLTVNAFWLPFLLAWLAKTLVRRYGGIRFYRQSVLFFVGVILGDILAQSTWTVAGRLFGFPVYQFLT